MLFEELLYEIVEEQFSEYSNENKWHNKKFQNIVSLPYTQRGKCVEKFLKKICEELNFVTILPGGNQSPWDTHARERDMSVLLPETIISHFTRTPCLFLPSSAVQ